MRLGGSKGGHRTGGNAFATLAVVGGIVVLLTSALIAGGAAVVGLAGVAAVEVLADDLPNPQQLNALTFAQPTVVYDRSGKIELGRFQREDRRVVTFSDVPRLVLDVTTTAEDRTFWTNEGYDPGAILSAVAQNVSGDGDRGASTITQQLVRARLLPAEYVLPGADRYLRKAKELIQAARVTQAFPGETGKQRIITAYLNEIFYGHDAYGIAAAAQIYFGVDDLAKLTPSQAALLAGLPQSPSELDPYRYAVKDNKGRLVVPQDAPPVERRNWILDNLHLGRWTDLTASQLTKAQSEPVVLTGDRPIHLNAPHFTWQVRRQLEQILGGRDKVETGGYTVITTLDWRVQQLAERWLQAGVVAPNLRTRSAQERLLSKLKIPQGDRRWIRTLRGKDIHNAALVAVDYRTGDVIAYAGSAGYYRDDLASKKFDPKFDAAGDGTRQPGSAWKPIVYSTAFDQRRLTPGSLLLDVTTTFDRGQDWAPRDADGLDRGPVLVRNALQYSLNVPAIRALQRVGNEAVANEAAKMGIRFAGGKKAFLQAGLAGALGTVEVRPLDLTAAYGVLGNGGVLEPTHLIREIRDGAGEVVYEAPATGKQVLSAASAFQVSNVLQGNTDPRQNPIWSAALRIQNGPHGEYRPMAVKTGTATEARDLATYGYLPPPSDRSKPAVAVGLWMGNSDHSMPRSNNPAISLTGAAPLWRAFVRDMSAKQPVAQFARPKGVAEATIDAWTGGRPGAWTKNTTREYFAAGTQPGGASAVDPAGLLYSRRCGTWQVDPVKAELGPASWDADVANWLSRARRGVGVAGPLDSRTAYFWGRTNWGGSLLGACAPPQPTRRSNESGADDRGGGHHRGGGGGDGGGRPGGGHHGKPPKPHATTEP